MPRRSAVTLSPLRPYDTSQPHLVQPRQGLQRDTHRLRDQLHPAEPANRRQHMRRIRALPTSPSHQPHLGKPIDHQRQQQISTITLSQTVPELAEHRMIESRLGQLHAQRVLPADATRHRRAACRSVRFSAYCSTDTNANRVGDTPPRPSTGNQSVKSSSTNKSCNRSRIEQACPSGSPPTPPEPSPPEHPNPNHDPSTSRNPNTEAPPTPAAAHPKPIKQSRSPTASRRWSGKQSGEPCS